MNWLDGVRKSMDYKKVVVLLSLFLFCRETPSTFSEDESQSAKFAEQKKGHHLNRTTPNQGGAILSSSVEAKKHRYGKRMVARSVDSVSLGKSSTLPVQFGG